MNTFELQLNRFIRAPREAVFDAFVDPAKLAKWYCPRGMSVPEVKADARAGGTYRIVMQGRGGDRHVVGGTYRELRRVDFLSYTWRWEEGSMMGDAETLIEVRLADKDGGTELEMRHSGFPAAAARDSHKGGWTSVFNRLNDYLDSEGSAGTVTVLGDGRSTYTRTVRMALTEKGVAYKHLPLAPHTPEVLAANPFGRIPVFFDGPIALYETSAIVRYVEECFDGPSLLPMGPTDRARCEQWASLVNGHLYDSMVRHYVLQYVFPKGEGGQPDRAAIAAVVPEMTRQLAVLEQAYAGGDFLAGATVSMADLFVAPILAYLPMFPEGKQLLGDCPNVRRAQAVIAERASFAATAPALA
jgi:glutathione S-transferase